MTDRWDDLMVRLRWLDPGRVRLHTAVRTIIAAVLALLVADAICRSADVPTGMVVIATVVAVLVSRSLHATSLAHRLSALVYVPAIGIVAAFTGRVMLHHAWLGAALFVGAVGTSRYLMRFGGKVRRFGRLALTPLISVLVVPVPPSAAKATGPLWGGVAGVIAVACVVAVQSALPVRPARQAAAAALDFAQAATRLGALRPDAPGRRRAARDLHRIALTVEDRLDASVTREERAPRPAGSPGPDFSGRAGLDALADAVLKAEVMAADGEPEGAAVPGGPAYDDRLAAALTAVRRHADAVRRIPAVERAVPDVPAPARRAGGRFDLQPQTRLAMQLGVAMAAAFAVGHLLFPHHWVWTVITAFVVCSAARSRGDVVHRSGLRIGGAFVGALTGTLAAHTVTGHPVVGVVLIFCFLLAGVWLRDLTYAAWAFCVTGLLAVLYGLNGEQGAALLVQRPEGIIAGSVCAIAAASFVLPLHTEAVLRARTARALQVLQDLLAAAREPEPHPSVLRYLSRRFDRAVRELAEAAAPARAHRALLNGAALRRTVLRRIPAAGRIDAVEAGAVRPEPAAPEAVPAQDAPGRVASAQRENPSGAAADVARPQAAPHSADWPDSLAACAVAVRALAAADPAELAAARPQLGLTALNLGQVRRRLGRRPDAAPPRPSSAGPAHLIRLNALLARFYEQLPPPAAPPVPPTPPVPPAPAPAAG